MQLKQRTSTVHSKEVVQINSGAKFKPVVEILHRENKVEHHSIPYQGVNDSKPHKPAKFIDINFSFQTNHDQHGAPSKRLNH